MSDDLFLPAETAISNLPACAPLAARMRPRTIEEFVGQRHILGEGRLLRRVIQADRIESLILYGPPGTGKTSLASIIAGATNSHFERVNAVESTVADLRRVIARATSRLPTVRTILFIDEIHRFNKAQQDVLLPDVESGRIRLIGATTQNPFFSVNAPLVSRSQIFQLEPLSIEDLITLGREALTDSQRGLGHLKPRAAEVVLRHLATLSDGDARKFLNALELAAVTTPASPDGGIEITLEAAQESIQRKVVVYDADGDAHYDTISAFIKSIRGSDPDASIYWLAKMLHAGEDIRFIARRIVICASEDIGLADPHALVVAVAAQQACEFVGLPEAQLPLAEATLYLATAPKSNSATIAIGAARKEVACGQTLAVPRALRCSAYQGSKTLGHGEGYKSAHDVKDGFIPQSYLPDGRTYYKPTGRGYEKRIVERLLWLREQFNKARDQASPAEEPQNPGG